MILSRIKSCLVLTNVMRSRLKTFSRFGHHWNYRKAGPPPSKTLEVLASFTQGIMWWWVLWHLFTEPQHITGEWEFPVASKWSDEELGIPPEEEIHAEATAIVNSEDVGYAEEGKQEVNREDVDYAKEGEQKVNGENIDYADEREEEEKADTPEKK